MRGIRIIMCGVWEVGGGVVVGVYVWGLGVAVGVMGECIDSSSPLFRVASITGVL